MPLKLYNIQNHSDNCIENNNNNEVIDFSLKEHCICIYAPYSRCNIL